MEVSLTTFTPVAALAGGALIGLSAVLLMALNGRIAGISGILGGALTGPAGQRLWRLLFLAGLVAGGLAFEQLSGATLLERTGYPPVLLLLAGLLVGFGTRMGSGCTSGHGVCGVARLSLRSLVATAVFMAVGMVVASMLATWVAAS